MFATLIFAIAVVISMAMTAIVRSLAPGFRLTDCPDGRRKLHGKAIPLGGGVAVFLATVAVMAGLVFIPNPWQEELSRDLWGLTALPMASAVVVLIGLADDRFHLHGRQKLFGQALAASILLVSGLVIERIAVFGYHIELGLLAYPFTLFWLLVAMNSVNLLDGIDGLATMLGIILIATFAALAAAAGRMEVAWIAMVFAGSLCGFIRFNLPPASIFLGDSGSMLIGLVVGTLAIQGTLKGPGTVLLAAPLAVWTIPILDSAAAILRRKLTGRSIYATDRGHLHHRLLERLGSNSRVLVAVAVCCAITSAAAVTSVFMHSDFFALVVCTAVIVVLAVTGLFGRAEFGLICGRVKRLFQVLIRGKDATGKDFMRLQGTRRWDVLWATVTESAEKLRVNRVFLDLDLPMYHENLHARWERPNLEDHEKCWRMDLPLVAANCTVGRLTVVSHRNGVPMFREMEPLFEMLDSVESQLSSFMEKTDAREEPEEADAQSSPACPSPCSQSARSTPEAAGVL